MSQEFTRDHQVFVRGKIFQIFSQNFLGFFFGIFLGKELRFLIMLAREIFSLLNSKTFIIWDHQMSVRKIRKLFWNLRKEFVQLLRESDLFSLLNSTNFQDVGEPFSRNLLDKFFEKILGNYLAVSRIFYIFAGR